MTSTLELTVSAQRTMSDWQETTVEVPAHATEEEMNEAIEAHLNYNDSWEPGQIEISFQITDYRKGI